MIAMRESDATAAVAKIAYYIRTHLDDSLDLDALAREASFSRYHFHRVFRAIAGEPLTAFVRRERLQRAARALRETPREVSEIALEAGYETPSAFARAFARHFGATPSSFRAATDPPIVPPHALPKLRGRPMEFQIETLPALQLLAVRRTGRYRDSAPQAFDELLRLAHAHRLIEADTMFAGLSYDSPDSALESELRYDACFTTRAATAPQGLHLIDHPAGRYAVYLHKGPYQMIEHVFDRLFDAVIFSGAHELRESPCVEIYLNDPTTVAPTELLTNVCIPVL